LVFRGCDFEMGGDKADRKIPRVSDVNPLRDVLKRTSKKGDLTCAWETVSWNVLRAFLCYVPDKPPHMMGAEAVLKLTNDEVLSRVRAYDGEYDLDAWSKQSWVDDLREELEDPVNGAAFGIGETESTELAELGKQVRDRRKKQEEADRAAVAALTPTTKAKVLSKVPRRRARTAPLDLTSAAAATKSAAADAGGDAAASAADGTHGVGATLTMSAAQLQAHVDAAVDRDRKRRALKGAAGAADEADASQSSGIAAVSDGDGVLDKVSKLLKKASKKKRSRGSDDDSDDSDDEESDTTDDEPTATAADGSSTGMSVFGRLSGAGQASAKGHPDHPATTQTSSRSKVPKLSKAMTAAATRMDPLFQIQKFTVEREGGTLLEANTLSDLFSAVGRQFRLEAKMDRASAEQSDAVLDYLDFAAGEAARAFKAQVKAIADRPDLVRSAEQLMVLQIKNKVRARSLIRKVDFISLTTKALLKVVAPIVSKEVEKSASGRGIYNPRPDGGGGGGGMLNSFHRQHPFSQGQFRNQSQYFGQSYPGRPTPQQQQPGMRMKRDGSGPLTCFACGGLGHAQWDDACPAKGRGGGKPELAAPAPPTGNGGVGAAAPPR
jgi:hypothetical protein